MSALIPVNMDHSHGSGQRKTVLQILRIQVKQTWEDLTRRASKRVIRSELQKCDWNLLQGKDIRSIVQSLYRKRRNVSPVIPKHRAGVHSALDSINLNCYSFFSNATKSLVSSFLLTIYNTNLALLCNEAKKADREKNGIGVFSDHFCNLLAWFVCLNWCFTSQSTAKVMLGCCLYFTGLLPKMRLSSHPTSAWNITIQLRPKRLIRMDGLTWNVSSAGSDKRG